MSKKRIPKDEFKKILQDDPIYNAEKILKKMIAYQEQNPTFPYLSESGKPSLVANNAREVATSLDAMLVEARSELERVTSDNEVEDLFVKYCGDSFPNVLRNMIKEVKKQNK